MYHSIRYQDLGCSTKGALSPHGVALGPLPWHRWLSEAVYYHDSVIRSGENTRPPILFIIICRNEKEEALQSQGHKERMQERTDEKRERKGEEKTRKRKERENSSRSIRCSLFFSIPFFFSDQQRTHFSIRCSLSLPISIVFESFFFFLKVSSRYMTKGFIHFLFVRLSLSLSLSLFLTLPSKVSRSGIKKGRQESKKRMTRLQPTQTPRISTFESMLFFLLHTFVPHTQTNDW